MKEYDPNEYDELWEKFQAEGGVSMSLEQYPKAPPTLDTDLQQNQVIQTLLYKMENALDALISDPGSRGYVIWLLKTTISENSHYRVESDNESEV